MMRFPSFAEELAASGTALASRQGTFWCLGSSCMSVGGTRAVQG